MRPLTARAVVAALTAAVAGLAALLLPVAAAPAAAAPTGQFTVNCGYVRSAPVDPIVAPGAAGGAELHDFFGNRSTSARSTYRSMVDGASSCPAGDRAAYWTPALYRNGIKIAPTLLTTQYSSAVGPDQQVEPFPPDFKMVVGNPRNTTESRTLGQVRWGCAGLLALGATGAEPPAGCITGHIQAQITFPSCWDGVRVNGDANTGGHLRFPSAARCPASHPRALPSVVMTVGYPVGLVTGTVTLSSGGGSVHSMHAAFWNTWEQPALEALVRHCLAAERHCGPVTTALVGLAAPLGAARAPGSGGRAPGSTAGPAGTAGPGTPTGPPSPAAPGTGQRSGDVPPGTGPDASATGGAGTPGPAGAPPAAGAGPVAQSPASRAASGDGRWRFSSDGGTRAGLGTLGAGLLVIVFLIVSTAVVVDRYRARAEPDGTGERAAH